MNDPTVSQGVVDWKRRVMAAIGEGLERDETSLGEGFDQLGQGDPGEGGIEPRPTVTQWTSKLRSRWARP